MSCEPGCTCFPRSGGRERSTGGAGAQSLRGHRRSVSGARCRCLSPSISSLGRDDDCGVLEAAGRPGLFPQQEPSSLVERKRYGLHHQLERNASVSSKVKRVHGTKCQCCEFDFEATYGALGAGYIEAHHLKPLALLTDGEIISYDIKTDFAVLCANCHRIINRMDDPSDLDGLGRISQDGECEPVARGRRGIGT